MASVQDVSRTYPDRGARKRRRGPVIRPFTRYESQVIGDLARAHDDGHLMKMLTRHQQSPRFQRLIQEAIERKRADGRG